MQHNLSQSLLAYRLNPDRLDGQMAGMPSGQALLGVGISSLQMIYGQVDRLLRRMFTEYHQEGPEINHFLVVQLEAIDGRPTGGR